MPEAAGVEPTYAFGAGSRDAIDRLCKDLSIVGVMNDEPLRPRVDARDDVVKRALPDGL